MNPYQQGQQYMHNIGFNNRAPQSFGNPMPMPGFPTAGYPGPAQGGFPQPSSAPHSQAGAYPSASHTSAYPRSYSPAQGYPQPNSAQGYPASVQGYPGSVQGYPSSAQGYPASNQGYPGSAQGHPASTQGHPASTQGYPGSAQGHPASTQGYPGSAQGYSATNQQGYPQESPRSHTQSQYQGYPPSAQSQPPYQSPFAQQQNVYATSSPATSQWTPPKCKPTVVPVNPFNPRSDAEILRKAMKGFGTDEKSIIQLLTKRSNEQRLRIAFEFKTLYGKDLIADLKSETSGKFEDLLVALMTPLPQFYAKELHDAMQGIGTDEDVLIEVMCTMSNHEIAVIKQAYTAIFGTLLEDDLRSDTSGNFKRLMTSLCVGNRSEEFHVDQARAREDARSLLQAGELKLGTDESVFNAVLCSRSFAQLTAIFQEYHSLTGHDIDDAIKNEFSGDIKDALRAIVKVVRNKPLFFAEHLHKSMKGMGTNDRQLIRIMVTRSEVDLGDISDMFQSKYGESLASWIEGDCSGHYKKCLLGLLGLY